MIINHFKKNAWEYIFFIVGCAIMGKQLYGYLTDKLELTFPHLVVFVIGCLMMVAPVYLVKILKRYADKLSNK